jgi:hypothetical protein
MPAGENAATASTTTDHVLDGSRHASTVHAFLALRCAMVASRVGLRILVLVIAVAPLLSCALLPDELNLSPIYRHRRSSGGELLELDVAWPFLHFERTSTGGSDWRLRPLYRYVQESSRGEHQFLWPLGRVVHDGEEVDGRLFPLWTYRSRTNDEGKREVDWAAPYPLPILPFLAGGRQEDGPSYFAVYPLYADIPGYLTYDRYLAILFPLYAGTVKGDLFAHTFLFWLAGYGGRRAEGGLRWNRFLPFWAYLSEPGVRWAYAVLWPVLTGGTERLDTDDPVARWMLWPLVGWQRSRSGKTHGWSFAWPFFQELVVEGAYYRLDFLWPLIRYHEDRVRAFTQWWVWPFVSKTVGPHQRSWSFLWPIVWSRRFQDPGREQSQLWVLPFYWASRTEYGEGERDDFVKVWPVVHHSSWRDGRSDWSILSPWPWREGNAYGVEELYGFLWTLAAGKRWRDGDSSFRLAADVFTARERDGRTYWSVPWVLSYVGDEGGGRLRLFQFLPIRIGRGEGSTP